MFRVKAAVLLAAFAFATTSTAHELAAQGKGGGKGNDKPPSENKGQNKAQGKEQGKSEGKAQGKSENKAQGKIKTDKVHADRPGKAKDIAKVSGSARGGKSSVARGKFARAVSVNSMPQSVRRYGSSARARDLVIAGAVSHAFARGRGDDLRIEQVGDRMRLSNRRGDPLLFIDDRSAENLGRWHVGVIDDDVREGAPSFCRSGAGHPVFGREWCVNKGFGLGSYQDYRWGRTDDVGDIVYTRGTLADGIVGSALQNLLGNTAFNRLALHAVTLGLVEPLVGRFIGEPAGPQYLAVNSGAYPVAELYDTNRDSRWDNLLVALRSW